MKSSLVLVNCSQPDLRHVPHQNIPVASRAVMLCWLMMLSLFTSPPCLAEQPEPGRLFYTPAQRAQLESARTRNVTQLANPNKADKPASVPPLRYDGVVTRSDGQSTRWVDGKAEFGESSVKGMKPGQTRANDRIYEPYQVLRPRAASPADPAAKEATP